MWRYGNIIEKKYNGQRFSLNLFVASFKNDVTKLSPPLLKSTIELNIELCQIIEL